MVYLSFSIYLKSILTKFKVAIPPWRRRCDKFSWKKNVWPWAPYAVQARFSRLTIIATVRLSRSRFNMIAMSITKKGKSHFICFFKSEGLQRLFEFGSEWREEDNMSLNISESNRRSYNYWYTCSWNCYWTSFHECWHKQLYSRRIFSGK